ncbi:peroxiredoxin family protein [Dehalococcoidia bacterium]|nr:peroxiredoxin family protein [Dehalococcoidia bacterium]
MVNERDIRMQNSEHQFPESGHEVPDFTLPTLDGEPINIREYRGKKVIVFMWASW